MVANENIFAAKYWFGQVDPRPVAIFRIGLGATIVHDLINYSFNLRAFLSNDGMLPLGAQRERFAWSIFECVGTLPAVTALFALGFVIVVAFMLGYRTRLATLLSWLFLTSLHTRNLYVTDGGDDLVRILLFGLLFTDAGRAYSLDVRLGRVRYGLVPALGMRFLQWHLALLYFQAGRLKFRQHWLTQNTIFATFQLGGFVRPLGAWLMRWPELCYLLGVSVVALEWLFAFLALSPFRVALARALAIAAGFSVQFGILLTLRVGIFTEAMLWSMALFLQPQWIDVAERWLAARGLFGARVESQSLQDATAARSARSFAFALLATLFIAQAWGPFIGKRIPPPVALNNLLRVLWLGQPMGLFDIVYDIPQWQAPGSTLDGKPVEVLSVAAPGTLGAPGVDFSRWYKFTFKERERPIRWQELGAYLCREYRERSGVALSSFRILEVLYPPATPGSPRGASRKVDRAHIDCTGSSPSATEH